MKSRKIYSRTNHTFDPQSISLQTCQILSSCHFTWMLYIIHNKHEVGCNFTLNSYLLHAWTYELHMNITWTKWRKYELHMNFTKPSRANSHKWKNDVKNAAEKTQSQKTGKNLLTSSNNFTISSLNNHFLHPC